jgi:hypothetical protein
MAMSEEARRAVYAAFAKMVARAWSDPAFKAKLLADPAAALEQAGVRVSAGMTLKIVEDTDNLTHLILPTAPVGELSEEALEEAAGGSERSYKPSRIR